MTTAGSTDVAGAVQNLGGDDIRASKAGFVADVISVSGRAVRSIPREPEGVIPALVVPLFFFVVNIGSLQKITEAGAPGFDFKAFQLPVAIIFAVTGISRASTLVTDIQDGYFDRLTLTPVLGARYKSFNLFHDYSVVVMR